MPPDSPTRKRNTHSLSYHLDHADNSRRTLRLDVPEIAEASVESLLAAVLPDLSSDDKLERLCNAVSETLIRDGRWSCLEKIRKDNRDGEVETFHFVAKIFKSVVSLVHESSQTLVECKADGNITPLSQRTNYSRPDGYVHLSEKAFLTEVESWADIVMPMEFKKASNPETSNDDYAKILWSLHQTMRNDPRRRFVFGLTLENTSARLWFNDRCGVVASAAFDINQDWRSLVSIVFGLTRATREELGFDPDMQLAPDSRQTSGLSPIYDITVHPPGGIPTVYRTVKVITDIGADSLIGRGTRVWRVGELKKGVLSSPHYVLKDVWVYSDRPVEHTVIANIKKDQPDYARYFLTVLAAGFALIMGRDSSQPDDTKQTIRRGNEFALTGHVLQPYHSSDHKVAGKRKPRRQTLTTTGTGAGSSQYTPSLRPHGHWNYKNLNQFPRRHYRIVFQEIGDPIYSLRNYSHFITAIRDGSLGLHAIHLTKLVHRDISAGNILLIREDGQNARGVIIDLEYIKDVDDDRDPHGVKTGTYEFMSVEVATSQFAHQSDAPDDLKSPSMSPAKVPEFRQNALHDLESIWWISMWTIFRTVRPDLHPTMSYHSNYWAVFESHHARHLFWNVDTQFNFHTRHLSDRMLVRIMRFWRKGLKKVYQQAYLNQEFYEVNLDTLEAARTIQQEALDALADATMDYPSELTTWAKMLPLPKTEDANSSNPVSKVEPAGSTAKRRRKKS